MAAMSERDKRALKRLQAQLEMEKEELVKKIEKEDDRDFTRRETQERKQVRRCGLRWINNTRTDTYRSDTG